MPDIGKLIERQVTTAELLRRLQTPAQSPGHRMINGVAYGPCLLVSRARGSGGDRVARKVGEHLGWQVFDREIVDEIAQRSHVREQLVQSVDERTRSTWEETFRSMVAPEEIGGDMYRLYLHDVLQALGHHGNAVIIGRGAQYLLPPQCALRLRLVAPLDVRVANVASQQAIPVDQARRIVLKSDSDRATFIERTFRKDAGSPLNYDLVLNTGELTVEQAAAIVLTALREKLGVGPKR